MELQRMRRSPSSKHGFGPWETCQPTCFVTLTPFGSFWCVPVRYPYTDLLRTWCTNKTLGQGKEEWLCFVTWEVGQQRNSVMFWLWWRRRLCMSGRFCLLHWLRWISWRWSYLPIWKLHASSACTKCRFRPKNLTNLQLTNSLQDRHWTWPQRQMVKCNHPSTCCHTWGFPKMVVPPNHPS